MVSRLIVSAQFGDAVCSTWSVLLRGNCTVATVFAGIPELPSSSHPKESEIAEVADEIRRRRDLDASVLESCGATPIHLDYFESRIRAGEPSPHRAIVNDLALLAEPFDEVWIPSGIGDRSDAMAAALAALELTGSFQRFMYAELPHATELWQSGADDDELPGRYPDIESVLMNSRFVPPQLPMITALDTAQLDSKRSAVGAYGDSVSTADPSSPDRCTGPEQFADEWSWQLEPNKPSRPVIELLPRPTQVDVAETDVFLSVLMRTQANRMEPFRDALTSLAQQACRDFELLILAHDVDDARRVAVEVEVDQLPDWLRGRTRIVHVHGGGRSRPLNVGIEHAEGCYIAVLDDDDFALPSWVAEFAAVVESHPGQIVRTRVLEVFMDDSAPSRAFPEDFDRIDHLEMNSSPLIGLAFPRQGLGSLGLAFDESLPVAEDWDFLLRSVGYLGIASSVSITSHYRRWPALVNSRSEHSRQLWLQTERRIRDKSDNLPLVLPPGSSRGLRYDREKLQFFAARYSAQAREADSLRGERDALQAALEAAKHEMAGVRAALSAVNAECDSLRRDHETAQRTLTAMVNSTSWRITAPIRRARQQIDSRRRGGAGV